MNDSAQDHSPQRTATRAPVGRPVRLQFDDTVTPVEGVCENISIGGLFAIADETRPAGTVVRFEVEADAETTIRGLAEVVWEQPVGSDERHGLGLKFRLLEQRDRQLIFGLVSDHIKQRLERQPTYEEPVLEDLSEPRPEVFATAPIEPAPAPEVPAAVEASETTSWQDDTQVHEPPWDDEADDEGTEPGDHVAPPVSGIRQRPSEEELQAHLQGDAFGGSAGAGDLEEEADGEPLWHHADADERPAQRRDLPVLPVVLLLLVLIGAGLAMFWDEIVGSSSAPAPPPPASMPADEESTSDEAGAAISPERVPPPTSRQITLQPVTAPPEPQPLPAVPARATPPAVVERPPPGDERPPPTGTFSRVLDISWRQDGDGLVVIVATDGPVPQGRYSHFRLDGDSPREVLRLLGIRSAYDQRQLSVGGPLVSQIRVGYHRRDRGNEQHVVMDLLTSDAEIVDVRARGHKLEVELRPR